MTKRKKRGDVGIVAVQGGGLQQKTAALRARLDDALAAVASLGHRNAARTHERVGGGLDPVEMHLDVLRLRLHGASADADPAVALRMTEAAALCDEARTHLDEVRRLVAEAGDAAELDHAA